MTRSFSDDTHDSKVQMKVWRRELGIRVHAGRNAGIKHLSYEWLGGSREIVIDPNRCPLTFSEFTLKEIERGRESNKIDDIPDGNDHSNDAVRNAMLDDVLRVDPSTNGEKSLCVATLSCSLPRLSPPTLLTRDHV